MRVIPPLEITPARLTSTSAVEIYANYDTSATYSVGDRVLDPSSNKVYESIIDSNYNRSLANTPAWLAAGKVTDFNLLPFWSGVDTYQAGERAKYTDLFGFGGADQVLRVVQSLKNANTNNTPPAFGTGYTDWWNNVDSTVPYYRTNKTYTLGASVIDTTGNRYTSLIAGNLNQPLDNHPAWVEVGWSNKLAMFNYSQSLRTIAVSPLAVTLTPGKRIDSIDLSGMVNVQTVRIQMSSGGSPVYDQTINMQKRNVSNWWAHFFAPFAFKKSTVKFDLPPYSSSIITVTFTSVAGNVEVGSLIIGSQFYIGATQYNAVRDYVNYSTVTREFDGSISKLVQRQGIPKTRQTVWLEKENVQALSEFLQSVDATPIAVSGIGVATDGYFEPIHVVGFIKSAPIDLAHPTHAICNMEIEAISSN